MKKILISLSIFSLSSLSMALNESKIMREELLRQENLSNITQKKINTIPEKYLYDESVIKDYDSSLGIISDAYYTGSDEARISISIGLSQDYEDPSKVTSYDLMYFNKISNSYTKTWMAFQLKRTTANFSAISDEKNNQDGLPRLDNIQAFTMAGAGVAYRFNTIGNLFNSQRTSELVSALANYVVHLDKSNDTNYAGYGLTTEYGINYRVSRSFFAGTKLSYNWATVERKDEGDEKLIDRSLVFGWLTLGIELGYYF